jgi:hypothetical protein
VCHCEFLKCAAGQSPLESNFSFFGAPERAPLQNYSWRVRLTCRRTEVRRQINLHCRWPEGQHYSTLPPASIINHQVAFGTAEVVP